MEKINHCIQYRMDMNNGVKLNGSIKIHWKWRHFEERPLHFFHSTRDHRRKTTNCQHSLSVNYTFIPNVYYFVLSKTSACINPKCRQINGILLTTFPFSFSAFISFLFCVCFVRSGDFLHFTKTFFCDIFSVAVNLVCAFQSVHKTHNSICV